jgi:hypothetical protein
VGDLGPDPTGGHQNLTGSVLHDGHGDAEARRAGEGAVARDEWTCDHSREGNVEGVIGAQVVPELPRVDDQWGDREALDLGTGESSSASRTR